MSGEMGNGDVVLAAEGCGCEIVLGANEHTAVWQAARYQAADIDISCRDLTTNRATVRLALVDLETFEQEIRRTERLPFENGYCASGPGSIPRIFTAPTICCGHSSGNGIRISDTAMN